MRTVNLVRTAIVMALGLAGCSARKDVPCAQDLDCNLSSGGRCSSAPTGTTWCSYPDGSCPSGLRYSDLDVGDGVSGACVERADAGVDAAGDGPGTAAFDVIYGDDWRIAVDASNDGWFLLVATGADDPDLSTIQVKAVSDSHPVAIVRVNTASATGTLTHGHVGGKVYVDNAQVYSTAYTEPRDFTNQGLLSLELLDAPAGDYMLDTHLELSVNAIDFTLDFKIHHVDSAITYDAPEAVKRRTIYR